MRRLLRPPLLARRDVQVLVLLAALAAFVVLAVIVRPGVPGEVDAQVHAFVDAHRDPALTTFFVGYTGLGRWFVLALAAAAVMVALSATARRREAVFLLVCMTASLLLNTVLKYVFARARPPAEAAVVHARGYAFPSGHAMSSATLALALVVVAWPTRWRLPVVALAAVFALLMGISRIYLGVHWLTDVLAGWCMAVAVVTGTQLGMGIVEDVRARGSQSRDAERDAARVERTRRHMAVAFLALMTASIVFAALVAAHAGRGLDGRVLDWAQAHPSGWIHSLSEVVGVLGSWPVLGPLTLAVAALFWLRRRRRDAEYFFATMFVSTLLDVTLKLLIRRPPIAGSEGFDLLFRYSFPSGHAMGATAFAAALAIIAWPTRWRWPAVAGGAAFALAVGLSRVFVAAHWPSDVVAAWALATAVALGMRIVLPATPEDLERARAARAQPDAAPIAVVFLDWGDTLMEDDRRQTGPMAAWPKVTEVEGAQETLRRLRRDYRLIVATNADASREQDVRAALSRVGLDELVDGVVSSLDVGARKPDPFFFRAALLRAGRGGVPLPAARAVMVGDSWPNDVAGAKGAGLRAVWFNRDGAKAPAGPAAPDAQIRTLAALPEALQRLGGPASGPPPETAA